MLIWTLTVHLNYLSTLYPVCRQKGFSTSQKKDGHVGGQKLVVESRTVPQTMTSTTDHKFTMLPFTSASEEAVCCAVIFQSKS